MSAKRADRPACEEIAIAGRYDSDDAQAQWERRQHKSRGSLPPCNKNVMARKPVSVWCKAFRNGRGDLLENQQHRHLYISLREVHDIAHSTCGYGKVFALCIPQQLGEHSFKKKAV